MITYNLDGSIRKRGSGRTKGAVSLVPVRFGDLKNFFNDESQVLMGRKFLESIGFFVHERKEPIVDESGNVKIVTKTFNFKTRKWETQ